MNTKNLNEALDAAEQNYQNVLTRLNEAKATIYALQDEVSKLSNDPNTKPATLSKTLMDMEARKLLLPAMQNEVENAHRHLMNCRAAISDFDNSQKAKAIRLEIAQRELAQMKRDYADREHQLK